LSEVEQQFAFPLTAAHSISLVEVSTGLGVGKEADMPAVGAADRAIGRVLQSLDAPTGSQGYRWLRNALGKPYVEWNGNIAEWARAAGRHSHHMHVSNSHDGGTHLVIAAYSADLVGLGIDLVWLPRLRKAGKDRSYFQRLARQFMSEEETCSFDLQVDEPFGPTSDDPDEALRARTAAHFSLMEAASKACGTGLKIGIGMGRSTSLPKKELGVLRLAPEVELQFGPEARARLAHLGAGRYEAHVHVASERLISVVALYR